MEEDGPAAGNVKEEDDDDGGAHTGAGPEQSEKRSGRSTGHRNVAAAT